MFLNRSSSQFITFGSILLLSFQPNNLKSMENGKEDRNVIGRSRPSRTANTEPPPQENQAQIPLITSLPQYNFHEANQPQEIESEVYSLSKACDKDFLEEVDDLSATVSKFREFKQRLQEKYSEWDFNKVETKTYFAEIQPGAYDDYPVREGFEILSVVFKDQLLKKTRNSNGEYIGNGIRIRIEGVDLPFSDNDINPTNIYIIRNDSSEEVNLVPDKIENKPVLQRADSLNEMEGSIRAGYWRKEVTWLGYDHEQNSLQIETLYHQKHPLAVRAFAISYQTDKYKTGIFFDVYDPKFPLTDLKPQVPDKERIEFIEHKRREIENTNMIVVRDGQPYSYPKTTYKIFSDDETENKWHNSIQLIDLNNKELLPEYDGPHVENKEVPYNGETTTTSTQLSQNGEEGISSETTPSLSNLSNNGVATLRESGDGEQTPIDEDIGFDLPTTSPEQVDSNYIFSDGLGKLFSTRCFSQRLRRSIDGQEINALYIYRNVPELILKKEVRYVGGFARWRKGIYEKDFQEIQDPILEVTQDQQQPVAQTHVWRLIGDTNVKYIFEYPGNPFEFIIQPEGDEVYTLSHNNQPIWFNTVNAFNTLQRFTPFDRIEVIGGFKPQTAAPSEEQTITKSIANALPRWTNITHLNLSRVRFVPSEFSFWTLNWCPRDEEVISWEYLFIRLGILRNLEHLDLSYNKLEANSSGDLCGCLRRFSQLQTLRLQGQDFLLPQDRLPNLPKLQELDINDTYSITQTTQFPLLRQLTFYRKENLPDSQGRLTGRSGLPDVLIIRKSLIHNN